MQKGTKGAVYLLLSLGLLLCIGTLGFMTIEGMSALDALFMTVITLSTVGFETLKPLSHAGKLFTIVLIVVGVATFSFHLTRLFTFVVEKGFLESLERRRMNKKVQESNEHYVICGHGRIGSTVVSEFGFKNVPLVVVERRPEEADRLQDSGVAVVMGDAREEAVLRKAGIERAKGLIALLPNDADNLYVILTARDLNPGLVILARACEREGERRLLKAGADRVISPHREGGKRMARMILNPTVTDFIEMATERENLQLQMEEFTVRPGSPLADATINETGLLKRHKILVVAIKRSDGTMTFNPEGGTRIHAGDALIVLGPSLSEDLL